MLDGFNIAFFFRIVGVLLKGTLWVCLLIFMRGAFEKSLNAVFTSLLPKVTELGVIKKFRPIGLAGSTYKSLVNVLASRLRKVVGKVVSPN